MKKEALKQTAFRITQSDWELFKDICEYKGSKASVKLRELVKQYINDNTDTITKILHRR